MYIAIVDKSDVSTVLFVKITFKFLDVSCIDTFDLVTGDNIVRLPFNIGKIINGALCLRLFSKGNGHILSPLIIEENILSIILTLNHGSTFDSFRIRNTHLHRHLATR